MNEILHGAFFHFIRPTMYPDHQTESDKEKLVPSQWKVSWGMGTQICLVFYFVALVLPAVVIVCTLPPHMIPNSVMALTAIFVLTALVTPFLVFVFAPHRVELVGIRRLRVYSFSKICLFSIELGEVSAIGRITFREYIRSRVRGWPTDWSTAVAIHLKDSSCVVISVIDPETFISDIKCL